MQIYSKWKWWRKFGQEKKLDDSYEKRKTKKLKRVDRKDIHHLQDWIYSLISALDTAVIDNFQIVRKLLEIACVSSIELTEAKQAASGIIQLKTIRESTMTKEREGNLNLIRM